MEEAYRNLLHSVRYDDMEKLLTHFSQWHRLTGTSEADKAAAYIMEQLKAYHIACERYEFDGYFSDPIKSDLVVADTIIPSKPRSCSLNCPQGIAGEVIYDNASKGVCLTKNEEQELYSRFRGKIVLSWNFYEDYVKKLEAYGAIGLIHIWASKEDVLHEETVGPVWGTPTLDNAGLAPAFPVVGIKREDGCKLIEKIERQAVTAVIRSWVEYRVAKVSLPLAFIPGRSSEYVLVSGHYDSWHEGLTDNATGNAACLEIARVFSRLSHQLERGIKIAWWPGHSNGRYMGSTWYCDHFWHDLYSHCIAHINIDSPGAQGGSVILPRTTRLEGTRFTADLIKKFLGKEPDAWLDIPRGADQSFWGVDIPFHIMYKYEPLPEKKIYSCPGSGGGWWWHSEFDSLDKVDSQLLLRDTRLLVATVFRLANDKRLPVDFDAYFGRMIDMIKNLDAHSDAAFDFEPVLSALISLKDKVQQAMQAATDDKVINRIVKAVGGGLNRLMYSSGSPYDFDNTFPAQLFPGLQKALNVYKDNAPPEQFLFTLTGFTRQSNRMVNEINILERALTNFCGNERL